MFVLMDGPSVWQHYETLLALLTKVRLFRTRADLWVAVEDVNGRFTPLLDADGLTATLPMAMSSSCIVRTAG